MGSCITSVKPPRWEVINNGGEGEHPGGEAGGDDDRVGRGRDRGGDKDKKKKEKERDEKKAYPAGKRLRP